jgi:hypothetical protein
MPLATHRYTLLIPLVARVHSYESFFTVGVNGFGLVGVGNGFAQHAAAAALA